MGVFLLLIFEKRRDKMIEFTEKELFCLARHMIAQHYEETYPLTYISLYSDGFRALQKKKRV